MKYELVLTIKDGTNDLPWLCPGLFVQTSIDGSVDIENDTDIVRMGKNHTIWNKTLVFQFSSFSASDPKKVALTMLRKRTVHQNYKLVGTAHFTVHEYLPILDSGMIERKLMIYQPGEVSPSGTLSISLIIRTLPDTETTENSLRVPKPPDSSGIDTLSTDMDDEAMPIVKEVRNPGEPKLSFLFHVCFIFFIVLCSVIRHLIKFM